MTMRVLIADDETVARRGVRRLLADLPGIEVAGEAASGPEVLDMVRSGGIDLLLLDINMPGMTGLEVVSAIGAAAMPAVVFITAYDRHAVRAFELHALDYLVKPFSEERFRTAIERARHAMARDSEGELRSRLDAWLRGQAARSAPPARKTPQRLRIEEDGRIRFVPVRDIRWVEAQDYCVLLHLADERILRRGTLKRTMDELDPRQFVRVHRSAAVNIRYVRDLVLTPSGGLTARLVDGTDVPVASAHRAALEARLTEIP